VGFASRKSPFRFWRELGFAVRSFARHALVFDIPFSFHPPWASETFITSLLGRALACPERALVLVASSCAPKFRKGMPAANRPSTRRCDPPGEVSDMATPPGRAPMEFRNPIFGACTKIEVLRLNFEFRDPRPAAEIWPCLTTLPYELCWAFPRSRS
jgi:hypothetical protein